MVRHRQDRLPQAGRGLSPATRRRFHLGHADQSLRARRQLSSRAQSRAGGADPSHARGEADRGADRDDLGDRKAAAGVSVRRRPRRCLRVRAEELFRCRLPQCRDRHGCLDRGIRAPRRRRRRLQGGFQVRRLAARRHAAKTARRVAARGAGLASADRSAQRTHGGLCGLPRQRRPARAGLIVLILPKHQMADKVALITGVTGQDGAYLAELLLGKGYVVHGIKRRSSSFNTERVDHLYADPHLPNVRFFLHYGDMTDATNLLRIVQETRPSEIYNLAAQSHVQVSFETPEYTANADALGTLRLLEAIRILGMERRIRFYQASSSELYGQAREVPQRETTPFYPRSPYAAAKLYAYWITVNYREAYGMHASNGILFNHEGPTRGETFVTRKITRAVAAIELGRQRTLHLGNLDAKRDWGHARDFVEGMWMIVQQDEPDDYVLATGETHSVREFVELAFAQVGREIAWRGRGADEQGIDARNGEVLVAVDPRYFRPTEVDLLLGDPSKARHRLGWHHKIGFADIVREMVESDLALLETEGPRYNPND